MPRIRHFLTAGLGLFLILLSGMVVPTGYGQQDFVSTVTVTACPSGLGPLEVDGETIECGTVTVPEDYSDPAGGSYELAFVIYKARSQAAYADPIIYLEGGPGVGSLATIENPLGLHLTEQDTRFDNFRQFRDVIWFDQRSTGQSVGQVDCSAESAAVLSEQSAAVQDAMGPDASEDAVELALMEALLQTCLGVFEERGAEIAQVNTENNARDVVQLVTALGYDTFNLIGISYGTRLALEVMRDDPDGLRSVMLDSVVAPDVRSYSGNSVPLDEAIQQIFMMCDQDTACAEAYPDLQARFQALLNQLEAEPIVTDGLMISVGQLLTLLQSRNQQRGITAYIPLMIWELEQGITDTYAALVGRQLPPDSPNEPTQLERAFGARYFDLPPLAQRAAGTAQSLFRQAQQLEIAALDLWSTTLRLSEDSTQTLAERFDEIVVSRFGGTVSQNSLDDETLRAYLVLPLGAPTAERLIAFANTHFTGIARDELIALATAMTEDEVTELFAIIHGESLAVTRELQEFFSLTYFVCNEAVPFNSLAAFEEIREQHVFPQVAEVFADTLTALFSYCDQYPDTWEESADFHSPVVSEVPTLVMVGNNDIQTAFSSGQRVVGTLANGQLVEFPDTGHGAIIQAGQCAQDIAASFLNAPMTAVNETCAAGLAPEFVLPPAAGE